MEDLQGALQSILSDPEQMARVAALAESLGLKPPDSPAPGESTRRDAPDQRDASDSSTSHPHSAHGDQTDAQDVSAQESRPTDSAATADPVSSIPFFEQNVPDLGRLVSLFSAAGGSETRVLSALRPTVSAAGQSCVDRALRAARLSRLAGALLTQRRTGNV